MTKMVAYHDDPATKAKYLARVRAHREADQIVKGQYWEKGKGCAVGCTIHGSDHARYETELGIPEALAWLEDAIFEGLPDAVAMGWPERFLAAIEPGVDLSRIHHHFLAWLLTDEVPRYFDAARFPAIAAVVAAVAALHRRAADGESIASQQWSAAESAAAAARLAAWSAARSAASAAELAAAAARSAAAAARSAARSAAESAESAAWSARSAAWTATGSAAFGRMADRLVEFIRKALPCPA